MSCTLYICKKLCVKYSYINKTFFKYCVLYVNPHLIWFLIRPCCLIAMFYFAGNTWLVHSFPASGAHISRDTSTCSENKLENTGKTIELFTV